MLTLTTVLSACSTTPQTVVESRTIIDRPNLILPETRPLDLNGLKWTVLTSENAQKELEALEARGETPVFIALTSDGYEDLSVNMQQLLQLISEQKAVIIAYDNYYRVVDATIEEHNSQ